MYSFLELVLTNNAYFMATPILAGKTIAMERLVLLDSSSAQVSPLRRFEDVNAFSEISVIPAYFFLNRISYQNSIG